MKTLVLTLTLVSLSAIAAPNRGAEPKRVIGKDTRVRINASNHKTLHDSIGLLIIESSDGGGYCTGTVIGTRHVVTAAHCLVSNKKFVNKIRFVPGINGDVASASRPFGTFTASGMKVIKAYFNSDSVSNDLGLLTFNENLPVAALPIAAAPSTSVVNVVPLGVTPVVVPGAKVELTIAGYPGDKTMGTLWEGKGARYRSFITGPSAAHDVDTAPGQSGSAVRTTMNGVQTVVGVHSSGFQGFFTDHNEARFFTKDTVKMLKEWMDE